MDPMQAFERAELPLLTQLYQVLKEQTIEIVSWRISSDDHRVKFFLRVLLHDRCGITTAESMSLEPAPGETILTFGGSRIQDGQVVPVYVLEYLESLASIIDQFPAHIRQRLNLVVVDMLGHFISREAFEEAIVREP